MKHLPPSLAGPVDLALAKLEEKIPPEHRMSGGSVYELKWDGYRLVIVRTDEGVHLWSRNRKDLTARFPDIEATALEQLPPGAVVDGEVVIWNNGRLDFDLLQRRLVSGLTRVRRLAREHPASFVAFDLLARDGYDLRKKPWTERREQLEDLAGEWRPPMELSPYTRDLAEAEGWFVDYRPTGIEGLVIKGAATKYASGRREWIKVKNRETREIVVGAVIPSIANPQIVVAGLQDDAGDLVIAGRTVPLSAAQSKALAVVLEPPAAPHPWPKEIGSGVFGGSHDKVAIAHVEPLVVAEVTADTALQAGKYRHPLRYVRHRPDLNPSDVPPL